MITGLTWLLACQLAGELVVRLLDVPVPGPVVGMLILFVLLRVRDSGDDATVVQLERLSPQLCEQLIGAARQGQRRATG